MRKLALSAFIILSFSVYALQQRAISSQDDGNAALSLPKQASVSASTPAAAAAQQAPQPASQQQPKPAAAPKPATTSATAPQPKGLYTDGNYTGASADAYYGYIQVKAVISGGKLADIIFLNYPNDRRNSIEINSQALPYLKQEAIAAQSANVNIISGATDSSYAFRQSLESALAKAKG
jgi:uncharacterized protein with FMN-binding domain